MDYISIGFYFLLGFLDIKPINEDIQIENYFYTGLVSHISMIILSIAMLPSKFDLHDKPIRIAIGVLFTLFFVFYSLYMSLGYESFYLTAKCLLTVSTNFFGILGISRSDTNMFDYSIFALPIILGSALSNFIFNIAGESYRTIPMIVLMLLGSGLSCFLLTINDNRTVIKEFSIKLNKMNLLMAVLVGIMGAGAASSKVFYHVLPFGNLYKEMIIPLVTGFIVVSGNSLYAVNKLLFYIVGLVLVIYNFEEFLNLVLGNLENKLITYIILYGYISVIVFKYISVLCRAKEYSLVYIYLISRSVMSIIGLTLIYFFPGCALVIIMAFIGFLSFFTKFFKGNRLKSGIFDFFKRSFKGKVENSDIKTEEMMELGRDLIHPQWVFEETHTQSSGVRTSESVGNDSNIYEVLSDNKRCSKMSKKKMREERSKSGQSHTSSSNSSTHSFNSTSRRSAFERIN